MTQQKRVAVVQNAEKPEPLEVIADAIIKVSDGFAELHRSRLTQRAVLVLLHDMIGPGVRKSDIKTVLEAAPQLKSYFIKKPLPPQGK